MKESAIFSRTYDLLLWLLPQATRFPRVHRFGLGVRVVRGGSWNNNCITARCVYRNRNEPDNFNNNIGFRLVRSHAFRSGQKCCSAYGRRPRLNNGATWFRLG